MAEDVRRDYDALLSWGGRELDVICLGLEVDRANIGRGQRGGLDGRTAARLCIRWERRVGQRRTVRGARNSRRYSSLGRLSVQRDDC